MWPPGICNFSKLCLGSLLVPKLFKNPSRSQLVSGFWVCCSVVLYVVVLYVVVLYVGMHVEHTLPIFEKVFVSILYRLVFTGKFSGGFKTTHTY